MQATQQRYLSTQKYLYSLINSREFSSSRAVLDAKAKQLWMNGYGKNWKRIAPLPYNSAEEESLILVRPPWSGSLSETLTSKICPSTSGFEAIKTITTPCTRFWSCVEGKVGTPQRELNKDPFRCAEQTVGHSRWTKRSSPAIWRVSQRAPIRNANLWALSLYLTAIVIQRRKTEVWYAKSRMGVHKHGSIMKTLA